MRKRPVSCLACVGLLSLLLFGCRETSPVQPVVQTTDQIAQVREWMVYNRVHPNPNVADTLHFLRLSDGYHSVDNGWSSRYTYDQQGRLTAEKVMAYRYSVGFGTSVKWADLSFAYAPDKLITTKTESVSVLGSRLPAFTYPTVVQRLALDRQGRVLAAPTLASTSYYRPVISRLFAGTVLPIGADTLRVYDSDGFLLKTEYTVNPSAGRDKQLVKQTVTNRNIERTDFFCCSGNEPSNATALFHHKYDQSKPGLRNPHQFLGNTNRNLIARTTQTDPLGGKSYVTEYTYEYDAENRVKRYFSATESYITVGEIYYVTP